MRKVLSRKSMMSAVALVAATIVANPASAGEIVDPGNDFLSTYLGPLNGDLDVTGLSVSLNGGVFHVRTTLGASVGTTLGAFYVYGVNRGAGTPGFASLGLDKVLFDQVIIVRQDGSISTAGAGKATFTDNIIDFDINSSLLTSTGFTPDLYGWNLWPRAATSAAGGPITGNAAISDFAPDNGTLAAAAVPEPSTWALMICGMGLIGAAMRRARRRAFAPAFA